jgi:hypothetical protein
MKRLYCTGLMADLKQLTANPRGCTVATSPVAPDGCRVYNLKGQDRKRSPIRRCPWKFAKQLGKVPNTRVYRPRVHCNCLEANIYCTPTVALVLSTEFVTQLFEPKFASTYSLPQHFAPSTASLTHETLVYSSPITAYTRRSLSQNLC